MYVPDSGNVAVVADTVSVEPPVETLLLVRGTQTGPVVGVSYSKMHADADVAPDGGTNGNVMLIGALNGDVPAGMELLASNDMMYSALTGVRPCFAATM